MLLKIRVPRLALPLALLLGNYAQGQQATTGSDIVTDRPDVTESSIVVPRGSSQFENGITWTADHGDQSVDFSETLVRFGLWTRTELRLVIPNYLGILPVSAHQVSMTLRWVSSISSDL